jgi:predicted Zn-dependent protease
VQYSNPQIPEGINVSATHPLLDFLRLLGGIAAAAALVIGAAALLADKLARHLPFSAEARLAARFAGALPPPSPQSAYLQALADRVAAVQDLPEGMRVRLHFVDEPAVNAFATLGGNIVVFRGLLDRMPSENALAMVIGHEIAHVKLRHPVTTLGRGLAIGVAVATLSAGAGGDIAGRTLGNAGLLTVLTFSRAQEREADAQALRAVAALYGHVADADRIFRLLGEQAAKLPLDPPAFLRTHPLDRERTDAIAAMAAANGWSMAGALRPIPADIRGRPPAGGS